jgi:hypothetical protein
MKRSSVLMLVLVLGACSSLLIYMPPHYSISEDNAKAIKRFGGGNINVGPFTMADKFDSDCGVTAGSLKIDDNLGYEEYIRQGLIDELRNAGMFDDVTPKITLSGTIEQLSVYSRRNIVTSTWKIGLRVDSSNGQSVTVTEQYNFDVGFGSQADCQKIADAYMPLAQNILAKFINAPEFRSLITP